MGELVCELERDDEVFIAVQTILNAFADAKKKLGAMKTLQQERDHLAKTVKNMQSVLKGSIETAPETEPQRKRKKTETPSDDSLSLHDITNNDDELNVALHSVEFDEDEIDTSQTELDFNKIDKPTNNRNKENFSRKMIQTIEEKSPTVLCKHSQTRKGAKKNSPVSFSISSSDESPRSKAKSSFPSKITPRRLNLDSSMKKTSTWNTTSKSKLALNNINHSPRLKQSTISFRKTDDETFCEGISQRLANDEKTPDKLDNFKIKVEGMNIAVLKSAKINEISSTSKCAAIQEDKSCNKSVDHSVVAIDFDDNEIISIESQSTDGDMFQKVLDVQKNIEDANLINNQTPVITEHYTVKEQKSTTSKNLVDDRVGVGCKECEAYHEMIGRDIYGKDRDKKIGVCSKHRRNVHCPETPPGFWNPTIQDTPEEEHIETPFETRERRFRK